MHKYNFYDSGVVIDNNYLVLGLPKGYNNVADVLMEHYCLRDKLTKAQFKNKMLSMFKFFVIPLFDRDVRKQSLFLNQAMLLDYDDLYKDAKITDRLTQIELQFVLTKSALINEEDKPEFLNTLEVLETAWKQFVLLQRKSKQLRDYISKITKSDLEKLEKIDTIKAFIFVRNEIMLGYKNDTLYAYVYDNYGLRRIAEDGEYVQTEPILDYSGILYKTGKEFWINC